MPSVDHPPQRLAIFPNTNNIGKVESKPSCFGFEEALFTDLGFEDRLMRLCLGMMLVSACVATAADQVKPTSIERLDAVAASYTKDQAFMGTVLVAENDYPILNKGYGRAVVEWGIPNTPDVVFRIGSLTKQFTATLILMLQDDGKLKIENMVSKYLPGAPKTWGDVTIVELLGQTSGISNLTSDKDSGTWRMSAQTPAELMNFFHDRPLLFVPGSKYQYRNSNYEVLGTIIEKVTGDTYEAVLRKRIFQPLQMENSGLDRDDLILPKRAIGYSPYKGELVAARS